MHLDRTYICFHRIACLITFIAHYVMHCILDANTHTHTHTPGAHYCRICVCEILHMVCNSLDFYVIHAVCRICARGLCTTRDFHSHNIWCVTFLAFLLSSALEFLPFALLIRMSIHSMNFPCDLEIENGPERQNKWIYNAYSMKRKENCSGEKSETDNKVHW